MTCRYPDRRGLYAIGCKSGGGHCRDIGNNQGQVWSRFRLALNTASHRCSSESSGRRDTPIDLSKSEGHLCEFSIPQSGLRIEDNNVLFFWWLGNFQRCLAFEAMERRVVTARGWRGAALARIPPPSQLSSHH